MGRTSGFAGDLIHETDVSDDIASIRSRELSMGCHLTMEQRQLARRLSAKGHSLREVGQQVGCSHEVVRPSEDCAPS
jgi:hypothetical protein